MHVSVLKLIVPNRSYKLLKLAAETGHNIQKESMNHLLRNLCSSCIYEFKFVCVLI